MRDDIGRPVWDETNLPRFPGVSQDITVDVAVIGAGLTGITTAYLLKRAGCRVALLDRRRVGGVDTRSTSAHVTAVVDTDLSTLESNLGRDHAQAVWDAGHAAIAQIEELADQCGVDCEFVRVPGFRHAPFDASEDSLGRAVTSLQTEAALARDLGFPVETVSDVPLAHRPGWRIDQQALFHPRKYLQALLEELRGNGTPVFEESEVVFDPDRSLRCGPYRIETPVVVVATHNPLTGWQPALGAALRQTQLALNTSYVVAGRVPDAFDIQPALFWDTSSPYRYIRVDRDVQGIRVVAGGEDHKTGQQEDTRDCFASLDRWISELIPSFRVTHRWSGQVIETPDGLPLIGEVAPGQFIATGFAGNGMTFGTLAAMILSETIAGGRANPWAGLFDVNRSVVRRGAWNYLRENADYPYYLVRDRLAGAPDRALRAVRRGEGALVEIDGETVAAYRDEAGRLSRLSPICTHLGCRVAWNGAERTWDCPCHGSRFAPTGEVLSGPAGQPLRPHEVSPGRKARRDRVAP